VRRILIATAFFAALIGSWKVATVIGGWSPVLLPPPESVAEYLWGALSDGSLAEATLVTLKRLLIGYAIGVLIGLPLGLVISTSDVFQDTIGALALACRHCRASAGSRWRCCGSDRPRARCCSS
jgi:NitT/TauT family transport system permease protein